MRAKERRHDLAFRRHPGRKLAAIYLGGVAGALIRVALAEAFPYGAGAWPWPTFAVNLLGAFLVGYFFASFRDHALEQLHHPFLATGVCGTLTRSPRCSWSCTRWSAATTSASLPSTAPPP